MYPHARPRVEEVIAGQSSSRVKRNMEDYLGKYLFFKKFDIVEDLGDHEYAAQGTTVKQVCHLIVLHTTLVCFVLFFSRTDYIFCPTFSIRKNG